DGMLNSIGRAVAHFLPPPDFNAEFPEGALQEIIKCKSIYDVDDDSSVAAYDPSKLAVLHRSGVPVNALDLAGDEHRPHFEDSDSFIVLPPEELASVVDPVVPHWDPKLGGSLEARRDFVRRLDRVGLVSWRRRERCRVGAFFVKKKGDAIRLALDCRPTNQFHRRPPKSDLATPGAKGIDVLDLSCAGMDLKDGFYQFRRVTLKDWGPPPPFGRTAAIVAPYVDNGNIIGGSPEAALRLFHALREELTSIGFLIHEEAEPASDYELVGRQIRGRRRCLIPRPRRMWRLRLALDEVRQVRHISPAQLSRIIGHLVDHFSARRELLSCLRSVYQFVGDGLGPPRALDNAAAVELRVAQGLLALAVSELGRGIVTVAHCSDSSTRGFALHITDTDPREAWAAAQYHERWRFKEADPSPPPDDRRDNLRDALAPGAEGAVLTGASTAYAQDHPLADPQPSGPAALAMVEPQLVEVVGRVPRLEPSWGEPGRRRAAAAGAWGKPYKIHNLEARAALMGFEDFCKDPANHSRVLLSLGDNMSEVLAMDRGRARSRELMALARRAAALQAAANARCARRHIETERNPSDYGSRLPHLWPGEVRRGRGAEGLDEGRLRLRPAAEGGAAPPPAGATAATPTAEVAEAGAEGLSAAGAAFGAAKRDPRPERPLRPARAPRPEVRALPGLMRRGEAFLEIFAGRMRLSAAAALAGLTIAVPIDIANGEHFNIILPAVAEAVVGWVRSGRVWAMALGTPRTCWSSARRSEPAGRTDRDGLECDRFTVRILQERFVHKVFAVLENPRSSGLWNWQPLRRQLRQLCCERREIHTCAYGAAWKKTTGLCSNLPNFSDAIRSCPGCQRHVILQGSVFVEGVGWRRRTSHAAAYPPALCRAVARVLGDAAPQSAFCSAGEQFLAPSWEDELRRAAGEPRASTGAAVAPPAPPRRASLGRGRASRTGPTWARGWASSVLTEAETRNRRRGQRHRQHGAEQLGFLKKLTVTPVTRQRHEAAYDDAVRPLGRDAPSARSPEARGRALEATTCLPLYAMAAAHAWISVDCHLRPSEGPALAGAAVSRPRRGAAAQGWALTIAPRGGPPAKNRRFDASVVVAAHDRAWARDLLELLTRDLPADKPVFRSLTLRSLARLYREMSKALDFPMVAHGLRHAGPSHDALVHKTSIEDIQQRGRWVSLARVSDALLRQAARIRAKLSERVLQVVSE
ncbi:unnamed protein product, partial [Prorocentrum cordatum]